MSGVQDILREELEYNIQMMNQYEEIMLELPRGSLRKKCVNSKAYYYLAIREGNKVKFHYLGKLSDEEVKDLEDKLGKRKRYRNLIAGLNKEIRYLKKVLNVKAK